MVGPYNRVGIGVVTVGDQIWVTFDFLAGPTLTPAAPAAAAPAASSVAPPAPPAADPAAVTATAG